ncbi:rhodanese-like domain-containing protein [Sulfurimonas sp. NWX367]|uniref:rhodanese-like domain-containing protein n=1 Tax=Sulfurimonas sp. NWX367 TaxID=2925413 RepID=UPI003204EC73
MKKLLLIIALLSTNLLMADIANKMVLIKEARKSVGEMPAKQLKALLDEGEDVIVLDVRESEQRAEGSIPYDEFNKENFVAITRGNLEWEAAKKIKDPDVLIVTYCRSGGRGALAAEVLKKMGYKNVTTLKSGLKGWVKAGYPVKTGLGEVVLKKEK